jgi:eukaryotic-like serine/threonine-protein kinase
VLDVRRDVPLRVAAAVDRALEKDPSHRFPTMDAFAAELEASLAELARGDADATAVIPAAQRLQRQRKPVSRVPLAIGLLAALAIAAIAVGLLTLTGHGGQTAATGARVSLAGVGAYDPFGDNAEHDAAAINTTDGSTQTYWSTEHYNTFAKEGVGLVLDAHGVAQISRVVVVTDTPGFTAQIRATNIRGGPTQPVSDERTVSRTTRFDLNDTTPKRFYVVWITKLPPGLDYAHVNEVRAFGKT